MAAGDSAESFGTVFSTGGGVAGSAWCGAAGGVSGVSSSSSALSSAFFGGGAASLLLCVTGTSRARFAAVGKLSFGVRSIATFMKSIHIGSAALAPVSFSPSDCRLSYPIHTPQVTEGEKPMNQASV